MVDGTRSEAKQIEEAMKVSEGEQKPDANGTKDEADEGAKLKRKSTMEVTAQVNFA